MIRRALDKAGCKNVTVSSTDGLITDYARGLSRCLRDFRQRFIEIIRQRLQGVG